MTDERKRRRRHRIVIKGIPDRLHEEFKLIAKHRKLPMTRLAAQVLAQFVESVQRDETSAEEPPERPIRPEPMF